jgi:hypothetical protein
MDPLTTSSWRYGQDTAYFSTEPVDALTRYSFGNEYWIIERIEPLHKRLAVSIQVEVTTDLRFGVARGGLR